MTSPNTAEHTRVLLVDDHDLIRKGLRHAFDRDAQFEVVGEAGSAAEGLQQAAALQPDVVIMDLRLPDGSGLQATRQLRKSNPTMGIVVLRCCAPPSAPALWKHAAPGSRPRRWW
jgi:DNA-binding NarL/FixJ family response regulator